MRPDESAGKLIDKSIPSEGEHIPPDIASIPTAIQGSEGDMLSPTITQDLEGDTAIH